LRFEKAILAVKKSDEIRLGAAGLFYQRLWYRAIASAKDQAVAVTLQHRPSRTQLS
jgi:hypothetical protein